MPCTTVNVSGAVATDDRQVFFESCALMKRLEMELMADLNIPIRTSLLSLSRNKPRLLIDYVTCAAGKDECPESLRQALIKESWAQKLFTEDGRNISTEVRNAFQGALETIRVALDTDCETNLSDAPLKGKLIRPANRESVKQQIGSELGFVCLALVKAIDAKKGLFDTIVNHTALEPPPSDEIMAWLKDKPVAARTH